MTTIMTTSSARVDTTCESRDVHQARPNVRAVASCLKIANCHKTRTDCVLNARARERSAITRRAWRSNPSTSNNKQPKHGNGSRRYQRIKHILTVCIRRVGVLIVKQTTIKRFSYSATLQWSPYAHDITTYRHNMRKTFSAAAAAVAHAQALRDNPQICTYIISYIYICMSMHMCCAHAQHLSNMHGR